MHILRYPRDDLAFCLRLYYFFINLEDKLSFKKFLLKHHIDYEEFYKMYEISQQIASYFSNPVIFFLEYKLIKI